MKVDGMSFRALADGILGAATLTPEEARAVTQLAYLASGVDLKEDLEESEVRDQLGRHVCALGGIDFASVSWPEPLPDPNAREERAWWLEQFSRELRWQPVRELAYVVAYLVAVGDADLRRPESALLGELQRWLTIDDERASELVEYASERVTPLAAGEGDWPIGPNEPTPRRDGP
ncbi:MAG: hypothetical protein KIT31_14440 [Deltaproteobacteria bacterium]|nr:hypothetical protein [Deltaproteobacteria bacterium]